MTNKLNLSPDLALPSNVVAETFAFLAKRGAGKTYAAMVLAEEMLSAGAQVVVLDPVAKWWGLRLKADGKAPAFDIPVFGGKHGDLPLSPRSGKVVATLVAERRVSVVLDISSFLHDSDRRTFVTEFARELYRLKLQQDDPSPLHVFLEEAEEFVPQDYEGGDAPMIGAIKKLCKLGRNVGIGVSLVSQRSADINKKALSQTEYVVALRTRAPQDLAAIKGWIEHAGTVEEIKTVMTALPTLPVGTAYVFGGDFAKKVKIRTKTTLNTSKTPDGEGSKKRYEPGKLSDKDIDKLKEAMNEAVVEAEAADPKALRQRVVELERQLKATEGLERQATAALGAAETMAKAVEHVKVVEKYIFTHEDWKRLDEIRESIAHYVQGLNDVLNPHLLGFRTMINNVHQEMVAQKAREIRLPVGQHTLVATRVDTGRAFRSPRPTEHGLPSNGRPKTISGPLPGGLTGPEQRVLDALAWFEALGISQPETVAVAFMANYKGENGTFNNIRGKLRSAGYVEYPIPGVTQITSAGRKLARPPNIDMTSSGIQAEVMRRLDGPQQRVLEGLLRNYPAAVSNDDLAKMANYGGVNGTFNNVRGRLRTLGLVEYPAPGVTRARDILFLEGS